LPADKVRLILGKKQQNQQNPAREHAHKSLELPRTYLLLFSFSDTEMRESKGEQK